MKTIAIILLLVLSSVAYSKTTIRTETHTYYDAHFGRVDRVKGRVVIYHSKGKTRVRFMALKNKEKNIFLLHDMEVDGGPALIQIRGITMSSVIVLVLTPSGKRIKAIKKNKMSKALQKYLN